MGFRKRWFMPLLLLSAGCLDDQSTSQLVPSNTFGNPQPTLPPVEVAHAPATEAAGKRVAAVGQQLVQANKLGIRPAFRTWGGPQLAIEHQGTASVTITEGLVNKCETDNQLTAVLAMELGKMISEREVQAGPRLRRIEREPPMELRVGSDVNGINGPADMTRVAELAPYEFDRQRRDEPPPPPPDPKALARLYLLKANVPASELDVVDPLLRAVAQNGVLDRHALPAQPQKRP
jgi:hypothetical protein